ncbi:MAG: M28 family peptidase [Bacteroidetes bacterium]|nr:M28 family peptidase [Bacteroidota bacterium]MBS1741336.1 M28 family peptidase [Bacteroidota bacterium]
MKRLIFTATLSLFFISAFAQMEKRWIKRQINTLSSPSMQGRGYVQKGVEKAANFISEKFSEFGLLPFSNDSSYFQTYRFPVNTFPGAATLTLQKRELNAGTDFIVHAASAPCQTERMKVQRVNLSSVKDSLSWQRTKAELIPNRAIVLKNYDTLTKYLHINTYSGGKDLPRGIYIIPRHGKLTWTVATDTIPSTIFVVEDTVMPKRIRHIEARLDSRFVPAFQSKNVIGYVRGTQQPDSFIVFSAHFDHLGKLGPATFPGAHDNASGTALMLYMANYFAQHPQRYSMAFCAFSGEEAGLLGSEYFVNHPLFPLGSIRFVINLDMTGDAQNGITVVNAVEQKRAFDKLREINDKAKYVPEIKERDQSRNSDHYSFSKKGVPSIFIYGNGIKPYYHDVFDKPQELSLENIDGLAKLLVDFVSSFR